MHPSKGHRDVLRTHRLQHERTPLAEPDLPTKAVKPAVKLLPAADVLRVVGAAPKERVLKVPLTPARPADQQGVGAERDAFFWFRSRFLCASCSSALFCWKAR